MPKSKHIALVLGYCISFAWLHLFVDRVDFVNLLIAYTIMFGVYVVWFKQKPDIKWLLWAAVITRIISFIALPNLSDDYFRFLWDGMITINGGNPYAQLPAQETMTLPVFSTIWLESMNSAGYYSVYPVFLQWIFAAMYAIGGGNELCGVNIFRSMVVLLEISVLFCLFRKNATTYSFKKYIPWLLLNPLYVVETYGNIHAEGLVIWLILLAIIFFQQKQLVWTGVLASLAVLTKLFPLIMLPVVLKKMTWRQIWIAGISGLITVGILSIYFVSPDWIDHQLNSVSLYFKVFEFNAGLYFLIRWIGFKLVGYNIIAWIGMVTPWLVLIIALYFQWFKKWKNHPFSTPIYYSVLVYFALSSIVHPWYAIYALLPGLVVESSLVLVWTYVVVLSYVFYAVGDTTWYYVLVGLEYLLLCLTILFEKRIHNFLSSAHVISH